MTTKKTAAKTKQWVALRRLTDGTKTYKEGQTVPARLVAAHPWLLKAGCVAEKGT